MGKLRERCPFESQSGAQLSAAVLGRGKSTETFIKVSKQKGFGIVILCNFDSKDLRSRKLRESLRSVPYVVLLSNSSEPTPSYRLARDSGITCVVSSRLAVNSPFERSVWRLNKLGLRVNSLPEGFSQELLGEAIGTGNVGVALATLVSPQVDIFGIEFYTTDYLAGTYDKVSNRTRETESLRAVSTKLKEKFENIVARQSFTQFTFHCHAEHQINAENVRTVRHEEQKLTT